MKATLTEAFLKDIKASCDAVLKQRVSKMLQKVETASSLAELVQVSAMSGHSGYYRYRLGDYRAGFIMEGDMMVFLRCLHRKEIYRYFP